ncbi:MAG: GNAT family N-acetyltransferase [Thermoflexales bacterium]
MGTLGAQIVPARASDLRRVLRMLTPEEIGALDDRLAEWASRPLGCEALAIGVLPSLGSVWVCLMNLEPAGFMVLQRGELGARLIALAVTPDMRHRGLAHTMLEAAERLVSQKGLSWMWFQVASSLHAAVRFALGHGYRRYRPQFLRREHKGALPLPHTHMLALPLNERAEIEERLMRWLQRNIQLGDAWCAPLVERDLSFWTPRPLHEGTFYRLLAYRHEVGLGHVHTTTDEQVISLWLEPTVWNTDDEMLAFKALIDAQSTISHRLDVELGSSGHLRASISRWRAIGFQPVLRERVIMLKPLHNVAHTQSHHAT